MKITIALLALFIISLPNIGLTQQADQTITLKDGTILKGRLVGVANGSYTIESQTVGQVNISADQVSNIAAAGSSSATQHFTNPDGKLPADTVHSIKTNMLQDPEIMSLMQELVQDPSIMEILKDPSLMQAALSMDPEQIKNNPQVQKLVQNPTMQKILKITAQKMENPPTK